MSPKTHPLPEARAYTPRPDDPPRQPPGLHSLTDDLGNCIYDLLTMQLADPSTLGWFRDILAERYVKMFPDGAPRLTVWSPQEC